MTPEQEEQFREMLADMTSEQREVLEQAAWRSLAKADKITDPDGNKVGAGPVFTF